MFLCGDFGVCRHFHSHSHFHFQMPSGISALAHEHLECVRAFYDAAPTEPQAGARAYRALLAHYYNLLVPADASVLEIGCGSGELLAQIRARRKTGVDLSAAQIEAARQRVPEANFLVQAGELLDFGAATHGDETSAADGKFDVIIISDTLNLAADVQRLL